MRNKKHAGSVDVVSLWRGKRQEIMEKSLGPGTNLHSKVMAGYTMILVFDYDAMQTGSQGAAS